MSEHRPRLLFLCQNLPYPADGGALIRSYHTLRLLCQDHDVTALCFYRASARPTPSAVVASVEGLGRLASVEAFPIPQEENRIRFVADHVRSLVGPRAYVRWAYESRPFRERLSTVLRTVPFEVAHLDSLDLVAYLPCIPDELVVSVAHHNVESQLLRRRAESERGVRRRYLRLQADRTAAEEREWCPRVDVNFVVSSEDAATLRAIAPGARCVVVPNGVDTAEFQPDPRATKEGLVFVGGHTWFPNRDGMEHFAAEILPLVRERRPGVQVTWVGRASEDVRRRYARHGITVTGYVPDIRPYVQRAACFVVPLRVGGGTRLKILDAWAMGAAVVSTPEGCEGLDARHGANIMVARDPEEFALHVLAVLEDAALRNALGAGGRRTVETTYDWGIVGGVMLDELRRARRSRGGSGR